MARVRTGLVYLTLDVPTDDVLLDWAATPNKPLAGQVVFLAAQGGSAVETLGWEAGQCVGYQEEFAAGDQEAGAYVCHLTIAAPKLTLQPGGPVASANAAVATGVVLETTLLKAEELASGLLKKVITPAGELGTEILGMEAATLARTASLTAGLLLTPANNPDAPGYRSELDLGKLTQNPTQQDKARLDYLENELQHRALSETEEEELASLLAVVRKVFVGGRTGLSVYYSQHATAQHLRQLVPDFEGVYMAGQRGEAIGEFDGINMAEELFIEDKSARGLAKVNPKTGLTYQTPVDWARKHVFDKTVTRIEALRTARYTYPTPGGPTAVPDIEQIRGFHRLHFRIDADTPQVRAAVEKEVQDLKKQYPAWDFTAQYGD